MVFGLLEKDVLCATMAVTTTMGVDLGFSWVFLGVFPFDFLSYSCLLDKPLQCLLLHAFFLWEERGDATLVFVILYPETRKIN